MADRKTNDQASPGRARRESFDAILEKFLAELPADLTERLATLPLIVEDEPSPELLRELGLKARAGRSDLCGLHWGLPFGKESFFSTPRDPDCILIFRGPISRLAGRSRRELERQIRITVLHEFGHHFGLDEERLHELGYG